MARRYSVQELLDMKDVGLVDGFDLKKINPAVLDGY
jgi:hypothetical protein